MYLSIPLGADLGTGAGAGGVPARSDAPQGHDQRQGEERERRTPPASRGEGRQRGASGGERGSVD